MWKKISYDRKLEKNKKTNHTPLCRYHISVRKMHVKRVMSRGQGEGKVWQSGGLTLASDLAVHILNFLLGSATSLWSGLERATCLFSARLSHV